MSDSRLKFLSVEDITVYEKYFEERKKEECISLSELRDLCLNNLPFSKTMIYDALENIKRLKDRQGNAQENLINICNPCFI
jgi:hypothetical protein